MNSARGIRGNVDYRAATAGKQMRQHRMTTVERRHQRAAHLRIDLQRFELGEGPHADRPADIVDQDVDSAEAFGGKAHRRSGALVGLEIGVVGCRPIAPGLRRHLCDEVGAVDEHHLAAFSRSTQRHSAADALSRTCDHEHLAGKAPFKTGRAHAASFAKTFGVNFS
ncbi:hypothetical protein D9M72_490180 [compost metagenome]